MLFVHGLWTTGAESFALKRRLAAHGWALRIFPWSSLSEPLDRVARRCASHALDLARETLHPVHLVGHSLGGIVIYHAFHTGLLAPDRFSGDFCRVVFLGTPALGSRTARRVAELGPVRRLLGVAGADALAHGLPGDWSFRAELGIIAGTAPHGLGRLLTHFDGPCDGTVALDETRLPGATDYCTVPVGHTRLALSGVVAEQVARFLEHARFDHGMSR